MMNVYDDKSFKFSKQQDPVGQNGALGAHVHDLVVEAAEAGAGGRVQHVDLDGDVQLLSCGRRQPQETVLQAVLDDVLLIRPHWNTKEVVKI